MKQSYGNTLLLQPYELGQGVKQELRGGFNFSTQKKSLVPLKVLVTAHLSTGQTIEAGSLAYIKEDKLAAGGWASDIREVQGTDLKVIFADLANIAFFEGPKQ